MTGPHHSEELERLREQVAELTRRVYLLEGLLSAHPGEAAVAAQPAVEPQAESVRGTLFSAPVIAQPSVSSAGETTPAPSETVQLGAATKSGRPQLDASLESRIGGQWLNRVGIVAALGLELTLQTASAQRPTLDELMQEDRDDKSLDRRR